MSTSDDTYKERLAHALEREREAKVRYTRACAAREQLQREIGAEIARERHGLSAGDVIEVTEQFGQRVVWCMRIEHVAVDTPNMPDTPQDALLIVRVYGHRLNKAGKALKKEHSFNLGSKQHAWRKVVLCDVCGQVIEEGDDIGAPCEAHIHDNGECYEKHAPGCATCDQVDNAEHYADAQALADAIANGEAGEESPW